MLTGHNRGLVKLFDIHRADNSATTLELKIGKSRQHAPVSSIDYSTTDHNFIALGSYDRRVYFTDMRNFKRVMTYIKMPSGKGVSQVKFLADGKHLMVASRRDNYLLQWDVRYLKEAFVKY